MTIQESGLAPVVGVEIGQDRIRLALASGEERSLLALPADLVLLPTPLYSPPISQPNNNLSPSSVTSASVTSASVTSASVTSASVTSASVTSASVTSERDMMTEMAERLGRIHLYLDKSQADTRRYVLTVPAYFTERQRDTWREAAWKGGLLNVRLVQDTLAPLLTLQSVQHVGGYLLVANWGSSVASAAVYHLEAGRHRLVAQSWDTTLGTNRLDLELLTSALARLGIQERTLLPVVRNSLLPLVCAAKSQLNAGLSVTIPLPPNLIRSSSLSTAPTAASITPPAIPPILPLRPGDLHAALAPKLEAFQSLIARLQADATLEHPEHLIAVGDMMELQAVQQTVHHLIHGIIPSNERRGPAIESVHFLDLSATALGAAIHGQAESEADWALSRRPARIETIPITPVPTVASRARKEALQTSPEDDDFAAQFVNRLKQALAADSAGDTTKASEHFDLLTQEISKLRGLVTLRSAQRLLAAGRAEEMFNLLQVAGRIDEAFNLLHAVWQRTPRNGPVALALARCCFACGEMAYSAQQWDRSQGMIRLGLQSLAIFDVPSDPKTETIESKTEANEGVMFDPNDPRIGTCKAQLWNLEGCLAANRGDWQTAGNRFRLAAQHDPFTPRYQENLKTAIINSRSGGR